MKITGSTTVSQIVKEFIPDGGNFRLEIQGDGTTVAGSEAKPTCRVAASDFFLALAGAGAVGEALLERAIRAAADRASGLNLSAIDQASVERLEKRAKELGEQFTESLPTITRPATLRVKGNVKDISGIPEHGFPEIRKVSQTLTFGPGKVDTVFVPVVKA